MKHEHKHDHCQHPHVKYCRQCDKPHCLDCGMEWNKEVYRYNYYPYGYWPYRYTTYVGNAQTSWTEPTTATLSTTGTICGHTENS